MREGTLLRAIRRGREMAAKGVVQIRGTVELLPGAAVRICEHLEWYTAAGVQQ